MKTPQIAFIAVIVVIVLGTIIGHFASRKMVKGARRNWADFATDNRLDFRPGKRSWDYGRVEGSLEGRSFAMWTVETTDDHSKHVVRTRMFLRPIGMPDGLMVYPRESSALGKKMEEWAIGVADRMGGRIAPEVTLDVPGFDDHWVVRGFDADSVRAWMASSSRQDAFLAFLKDKGFDSGESGLHWEGYSPRKRPDIETIVVQLETHAKRIEGP